jgi:DNA-binding NtrC family response regulator
VGRSDWEAFLWRIDYPIGRTHIFNIHLFHFFSTIHPVFSLFSTMELHILIIDDEKDIRNLLAKTLEYEGFTVFTADKAKTGLNLLKSHPINVVLCDIKLPDGNGIELTVQIKIISPATEIICFTAYGNIQAGVQAMKNGAFDYLVKGDDQHKVIPLVHKAGEKSKLQYRIQELEQKVAQKYDFSQIIGKSPAILQAVELARKVAPTEATVLLTGPTGTGKEVFAQSIHSGSGRKAGGFVAVNCGAFGKDLLESELFGYKAGAFTGAVKDKRGLFEEAHGGSIFLDEIGELNPDLQAKLLRVLEARTFIKLGDTRETAVDVRVIAATNRQLEKEVEQGHFREDLFYRLSVFQIRLPSLNERLEDLPELTQFFTAQFAHKSGKKITGITPAYHTQLSRHSWKGNIRELRNLVERSVILADQPELTPDLLPIEFETNKSYLQDQVFALAAVEKEHIARILDYTGGNKTRAAELLGIGLTTLYRKLEEYRLTSG